MDEPDLGDACEAVHGEECETEAVDLPADGEELLYLGDVTRIVYVQGITEYTHKFEEPTALWAWPGGVIINAAVEDRGLED